ncbi:hypothetical protein HRbin12_01781 [bacterium HR12]|nr:hypothetical protein HRbin12_01781 [bacterium HR12]
MISTMSWTGLIFIRSRPGSPWMPMPISISSSPSSKVGLPACGTVQEVRAMPIERPFSFTRRAICATSASGRRSSAAAPAIFSMSTVVPTPRRPAV